MIEGKRIFITGGAGFIGSTLIERLIDRNEITVFDSFKRDALSGKSVSGHKNLKIVRGSVTDAESVESAIGGHDVVLHLAAVAGIDTVILKPVETMRVNMVGTLNVLDAIVKKCPNLDRFVTFSTSEVFGSSAFRAEESQQTVMGAVGEARWTYAVSKLGGEHLTYSFSKQHGVPFVIVRPFNVYGPGQIGEGAIRTFILKAINNEDIEVHGDGAQIRAWCYVDDMVDGALLCLEKKEAIGESFNVGNAKAVVTIYGLANTVVRVCGSKSAIHFARKDYVDVELRVPNVKKARDLLGFEAKIDLEEGIRRTAEFYRSIPPEKRK